MSIASHLLLAVVALQGAGWKQDVSGALIPSSSAHGRVAGADFIVDRAELNVLGENTASDSGKIVDRARAYNLILRRGKEFFADQEIMVFFAVDPSKKLDGMVIAEKPVEFGTDAYRQIRYPSKKNTVARGIGSIHMSYRVSDKKLPSTEMFSDRFSARIVFGKQKNGMIPLKVYITLPDKNKSFVAGVYTAKMIGQDR